MSGEMKFRIVLDSDVGGAGRATAALDGVTRRAMSLAGVFRSLSRPITAPISFVAHGIGSILRFVTSLPALLATGMVGGGLFKTVRAAMDAQRETNALAAALRLAGDGSAATLNRMNALADSIARVTLHEDEAVRAGMTFGLNMGIPIERMEDVTIAAIGLAKKAGMDLPEAFRMFGMASSDVALRLAGVGIKMDATASASEKMNVLIREGSKYFNSAVADSGSWYGRYAQMMKSVGEFSERVGTAILETTGLADAFDRIKDFFDNISQGAIDGIAKQVRTAVKTLGGLGADMLGGDAAERQQAWSDVGALLKAGFRDAVTSAVEILMKAAPIIGDLIGSAARTVWVSSDVINEATKRARQEWEADNSADFRGSQDELKGSSAAWVKSSRGQKRVREIRDEIIEEKQGAESTRALNRMQNGNGSETFAQAWDRIQSAQLAKQAAAAPPDKDARLAAWNEQLDASGFIDEMTSSAAETKAAAKDMNDASKKLKESAEQHAKRALGDPAFLKEEKEKKAQQRNLEYMARQYEEETARGAKFAPNSKYREAALAIKEQKEMAGKAGGDSAAIQDTAANTKAIADSIKQALSLS